MYCPYCGDKIDDNSVYCPNCGRKVKTDPKNSPAAIYESIHGKQKGGETTDSDHQSVNKQESATKETNAPKAATVPATTEILKNLPKSKKKNKKEDNIIIPDSELTNDEMDVLNIRMSYFSAGSGSKDAAVSVGTAFAGAITNIYGLEKRTYGHWIKRDYQKQYENERNRIKRIIVANRSKSDKITYQSLGYKQISYQTHLPIRGDLQIEPNREQLLDTLQKCYRILDNSDNIQAMAVQPMQKSAELYLKRYKFGENVVLRTIVSVAVGFFVWLIVTIILVGLSLAPMSASQSSPGQSSQLSDSLLIVLALAGFVIGIIAGVSAGKKVWKRWNKPIRSERDEMQKLDTVSVEYIQASYQYINDNFGIFYILQSKYWNKDSISFLYDAISNKRECGTWGQALNSLDAYLARVEIHRKQDYQTAIMEKAAREATRAADAAEDAAFSASMAARNSVRY